MPLSVKYKQQLKAQAHTLKPVIMIGDKGLTESVQKEINVALIAHELIKLKIAGADREVRRAMLQEICQVQGAELVQIIGHIGVIYRKNIAE